jgi:hypothetical protein
MGIGQGADGDDLRRRDVSRRALRTSI